MQVHIKGFRVSVLGPVTYLTKMQDADLQSIDLEMQEAFWLARFHPCVTAVYGLCPYAKPKLYRTVLRL